MNLFGEYEFQELPIGKILPGNRQRALNQSSVDELKESLSLFGLEHPISVGREMKSGEQANFYPLGAGAHRLAAAKALDWKTITCKVYNCERKQIKLLELVENLNRYDLSILDRGCFITRFKEWYEEEYPASKKGGDRRSKEFSNNDDRCLIGYADQAKRLLNLSISTVRESVSLYKKLDISVARKLSGQPEADNRSALKRLATLTSQEQVNAVEWLFDDRLKEQQVQEHQAEDIFYWCNRATGVPHDEAGSKDERKPDPVTNQADKLKTTWENTKHPESKKRFLELLAKKLDEDSTINLAVVPKTAWEEAQAALMKVKELGIGI